MKEWLTHPVLPIALVLAPVIFTVIGPFYSYSYYNTAERLVLWTLILWSMTLVGIANRIAVDRIFEGWNYWLRSIISAALLGLIATPVLRFVMLWLIGVAVNHYPSNIEVFATCALSSFSVAAMRRLLRPIPPLPETEPAPEAPMLKRLQVDRLEQVIRITSREPSGDVFTDEGVESFLMRLTDAAREMGEGHGMFTHRSHWVMKSAVLGSRREGSKIFLVMNDGSEVPVSRTYRQDVEDAGLLTD
jgi:hypothetical protein